MPCTPIWDFLPNLIVVKLAGSDAARVPYHGRMGVPLDRPFRLIAFDWDGTAVAGRQTDAGPLRRLIERLLLDGVLVYVITGTHRGHVDRQLADAIRGSHKQHLFLATNRGSEVFGFGPRSEPVLLWQRQATDEENRTLTRIADQLKDGLDARVIYDRLNRRKVDLLPAWQDPPKSRIKTLLAAVQERLHAQGHPGGIAELAQRAIALALREGLADARVTSDAKHLEIGLTDKGDSIRWMWTQLARPRGIPTEEILVVGDEFGTIGGFEGSDAMMCQPELKGAVFVSVGVEPEGVPPGVRHLQGGPDRFAALLAVQVTQWEEALWGGFPLRPVKDCTWLLVEAGYQKAREHEIESLMTVANGTVGSRGSLAEGGALSAPATFVNGLYRTPPSLGAVPEMVKAPNWMEVEATIEGQPLRMEDGKILSHARILDLNQGILWRYWRHQDSDGRISQVAGMRLASLADRHLLLQVVTLKPENYSGQLRLETSLRSDLAFERAGDAMGLTIGANSLSMGTTSQVVADNQPRLPRCRWWEKGLTEGWDLKAVVGQSLRLERAVVLYSSRDAQSPDALMARKLEEVRQQSLRQLVSAHVQKWHERWRDSDVRLEGDEATQHALRFALYHLIGHANPDDAAFSIGARGLTGEGYKGHVFWDTELYMFPFYLHTHPRTARALLGYRYRTLEAARVRARDMGYQGALFPWESTDSGEDATPDWAVTPTGEVLPIWSGRLEHHISAAVAYATWQYWQAAGDADFLAEQGAEIMIETARFWASRGRLEADGRYHIRQVVGPDEYHSRVDDNAYTNLMAQWNLERGLETVRLMASRSPDRWGALAKKLAWREEEADNWLRLAEAMYVSVDRQTGVIEQFQGFFGLEQLDLQAFEPRTAPIDLILGPERTQRTQVIKQADVLMAIFLLWDRFPPEVRKANFCYYEPKTAHGSSLSPGIHALLAARLGDMPLAERTLRQAAEIDLANNMGNAAGGVHMGALGGLWQAVVMGYAGLTVRGGKVRMDPHMPEKWQRLRFPFLVHGSRLQVELAVNRIGVRVEGPEAVTVELGGLSATLLAGRRYAADLKDGNWGEWREEAV